jgi:hypothetical protein
MTICATPLASTFVLARLCRRCPEHLTNGPNGGSGTVTSGTVTWPLTKWIVIDGEMVGPRWLAVEDDVVEIERLGLLHLLMGTGFGGDTADLAGARSSTHPVR